MFKKKLLIVFIIVFSSAIYADCEHRGRWYPEGTTMGPYVCINGQWIRR